MSYTPTSSQSAANI